MNWIIKTNSIILYFYGLLIFGMVILVDYALFSILLQFYNVYVIILSVALINGLGTLFALNTIIALIQKVKKLAPQSFFKYALFAQIVITIAAGTLMTLPGLVSSAIGWLVYFKPMRVLLVHIFYKYKSKFVMQQYSYFLVEYL